MMTDDDDADEPTVDVILGSLPLGRRITVELRKRKWRDCTEPPTV